MVLRLTKSTVAMDKRSIFFIISLTLGIFAVNLFFTHRDQETNKQWIEQQHQKRETEQKKLAADISQRMEKDDQLPLISIYSDVNGEALLTTGVRIKDAILVLPWAKDLPKSVFAKKTGSTNEPEEFFLNSTRETQALPAIYARNPEAKLEIAPLSEFGKFDLQLVSPKPQNPKHPFAISLGEYIGGHFSLPAEKLKNEDKKEQSSAIVLLKTLNGYLPVAIYLEGHPELTVLEDLPELAGQTILLQSSLSNLTKQKETKEKFYVLENEYQQLVFSNIGGALAEINLPFLSPENKRSVVREIEFDREMVKKHPYNAHFPSQAYSTPGKDSSSPFKEHSTGKLGGYYPLLRRNLIEANGRKSIHISPSNYALNIVSEYPEVAELVYEVKEFDEKKIVFEAIQSHRRITKTYTIENENSGAPYCINLTIQIEGDARGLWVNSGVPDVELISGSAAPALKLRNTRNQKTEIENLELPADAMTVSSVYPDWICNSNGFLGLIVQPLTPIDPGYKAYRVSGTAVPSRLVEIGQEYQRFKAADLPGYAMALPLKTTNIPMSFRIYAGPFAESTLKAVDKAFTDPVTGQSPDYIACQSFHGWFAFISEPFAKFLFILMKFFHYVTGSWAFSIVLLTVALRIMLYPLNAWSMKSMLRMQQIAPEVTAIQEKHKKDPKKSQIEIMNLYRDRGINPLSGCFPLLIQMPFLIGMFDLLKSTFELRGASFIPGWIDNLTAPDVLFRWNYPLTFIGNEFHLLPILLGAVMFIQQRTMSSLPKDPSLLTDQQRQQRTMGTLMTVLFAVMFYNFPSGLNIYWLSSMLLGILQQWLTNKQMKTQLAPVSRSNKKR